MYLARLSFLTLRDTPTEREWNFRDDNYQHFHGDIPEDQPVVSLTLNWRADAESQPMLVGRYKIDLRQLLKAGYVRENSRGILLRFQRSRELIEIAINRSRRGLVVGRRPR